jgi:predicted metal-dependent phosphoesterase TrpH
MRRKIEPLLCELHAHTRWSDGALILSELVDLYGRSGFDVLCVTDHVCRGAERGAALVAAHPYRGRRASSQGRATRRFSRDWRVRLDARQ